MRDRVSNFSDKYAKKRTPLSFTERIVRENLAICELCFEIQGQLAWYIIHVDTLKITAFRHNLRKMLPMSLAEYGAVLYSGWGRASPGNIRAELHNKYGVYE